MVTRSRYLALAGAVLALALATPVAARADEKFLNTAAPESLATTPDPMDGDTASVAATEDATEAGDHVTSTIATPPIAWSQSPVADRGSTTTAVDDGARRENSWRYRDGELVTDPSTEADAPANGGIATMSYENPENFTVTKSGSTYKAMIGGRQMTVTNAKAFGIDVSQHNDAIGWKKVRAAGVDYAIIRCGWGTNPEKGSDDTMFWRNYQGAKAAGLKVGVYLYSYAGWKGRATKGFEGYTRAFWVDYARQEAEHVLIMLSYYGIKPGDLDYPIYYDLEERYLENRTLSFKDGNCSNTSFLAQIAKTFCDTVQAKGYRTGVYANLNWWNNFLTDSRFSQWERWVARYPLEGAPNQVSQYKGAHGMWQFHSEARVSGISTCVDVNFDYLTRSRGGCALAASGDGSMARLYNPNSGEHFYTASTTERDHLVRLGWRYEGDGWKAPSWSATPVYRLYNPNAGDHHYTTSTVERDSLVRAGWNDEGVGWYSADKSGVAIYRQYNPNAWTGTHNYTASKAENDKLASLGWRPEGIAWYGLK